MNYLNYKVSGDLGDVVRVKIDTPAFVRLLDPLNFEYYRIGRQFKGQGGWQEKLVVEFDIPYKGNFHVLVDLGKDGGMVKASVDKVRGR